jgi:CRISPR-associated endonuclease Csn1
MQEDQYILGLDIGTNSIGWALLRAREQGERLVPMGIERTGVRIFQAGVAGSIEQGKTESHAKARREARTIRRNIFRDGQRLRRAFMLLQQAGLLPGEPGKPSQRDATIKTLDTQLRRRWEGKLRQEGRAEEEIKIAVHHNLPYLLRARGLDEKLEPFELGRAFYQLAQRRGFKSTRKNLKGKDESERDQNSIEKEAHSLQVRMDEVGARTLGEYFARYNPFATLTEKIRGTHTVRAMYQEEFERLWEAQARHFPDILTPRFKQELLYDQHGIFWQRALKSQENLIGDCPLEAGEKRAPMSTLEAQRFRYLQKLNDTRIILAEGGMRALTPEERQVLIKELEVKAALTLTEAKKLLGADSICKCTTQGIPHDFVGCPVA